MVGSGGKSQQLILRFCYVGGEKYKLKYYLKNCNYQTENQNKCSLSVWASHFFPLFIHLPHQPTPLPLFLKQVYIGSETSYCLTHLEPSSGYYVRVCGVRQCGDGETMAGAYSSPALFNTPKPAPTPATRTHNPSSQVSKGSTGELECCIETQK